MVDSNLDRLYSLLSQKTGISRIRDVRLEKIAADRALEMRYHQGLVYNPNNTIVHEHNQLQARVYPFQDFNGATENALWHYYPPQYVDPVQAAVDATFVMPINGVDTELTVGWWNSPVHRGQLQDVRWTHWGHGIYFEDTSMGSRRWYFITVFGQPMKDLTIRQITLSATMHVGYHLTADGNVIHKQTRSLTVPTVASIDDRVQMPSLGPMVHMATKPLKGRWVKDNSKITWGSA